jgi:hypothetical protein
MAIESPLFQSSAELLAHSISHYVAKDELDRKLVILHLANAVELILKDVVLDHGDSIYRNPKETITIHGCFDALKEKKVSVPHLNKIELLIDERNALQHRFGSPNELTSIFYMNVAMDFFRDLLNNHYHKDLEEILDEFADKKDLVAFRRREPSDETELDNLKKLAKEEPLAALLAAFAYRGRLLENFLTQLGVDNANPLPRGLRDFSIRPERALQQLGVAIPEDFAQQMEEARRLNSLTAHGRAIPETSQAVQVIEAVEKFETFVQSLNKEALKQKVQTLIAETRSLSPKPVASDLVNSVTA